MCGRYIVSVCDDDGSSMVGDNDGDGRVNSGGCEPVGVYATSTMG